MQQAKTVAVVMGVEEARCYSDLVHNTANFTIVSFDLACATSIFQVPVL
jgi:hypothetical protein